ncbi:Calmodulin-binding transcription activator 5 [Dionaea muscipula]
MEIGIVSSTPASLMGWEIHGFRTMEDLDIKSIKNEAKSRWLRPNEIHAILSNSSFFTINVKPVNLPKSGTILLFDRKMLRNFRKDGHNWKKKKDGKTVKEAHEHLKVGSEERIHVYYAHGQDNPNFVRRCYWLLDKALEHIVLVHYHETQGSPAIPVISHSGSDLSDLSGSRLVLEETDSGDNHAQHSGTKEQFGSADYVNEGNHAMRLHEINTLDWDELVVSNDRKFSSTPGGDGTIYFRQSDHYDINNLKNNVCRETIQQVCLRKHFPWGIPKTQV